MTTESFKVVLVGDSNVGKTSLITRYTKDTFDDTIEPTVGAHFMTRIIDLSEHGGEMKRMKLQIWDTAGQEKYKSVTQIYYRDAAAAICVFDVTNAQSLTAAERWLEDLRKFAPPHLIIALAANKSDLYAQQEVTLERALGFQREQEVEIFQSTSAKEGSGVEEIFTKIALEIEKKRDIYKDSSIVKRSNASLATGAREITEPRDTKCKC